MFCSKCGVKNVEGAKFCKSCGAPLKQKISTEQRNVPKQKKSQKNKSKMIIGILIGIIMIALLCALFLMKHNKVVKAFDEQLVSANKYMEEMDYEQAEAAYLAAIDIDPKKEEPYLKLAEIYEEQNEPEKAKDILEKGYDETKSDVIKQKLSLYTYVEDVLIPEIGQAQPGTYEVSHIMRSEYSISVDVVHDQSGVITSRIKDFDGDGEDELLVAVLKYEEFADVDYTVASNNVYAQMYEMKGTEVVLAAETEVARDVLGGAEKESSGLFLKEYDGAIYICGGEYDLVYQFADGSSFTSCVMCYKDEQFVDLAGSKEVIMGSSFEDLEEEALHMARVLESIDLPRAASDVRDSWMLRMSYEDDMIDVLFRTEGKVVGADQNLWEYDRDENYISHLGKVVIEFWIPEPLKTETVSAEAVRVPKDVVDEWQERLELVEADTEANTNEGLNQMSMQEMIAPFGAANKQWTNIMNELLEELQTYMTTEEWEQICEEQKAWEQERDSLITQDGGSLGELEYAMSLYEMLKSRSFELFENLSSL